MKKIKKHFFGISMATAMIMGMVLGLIPQKTEANMGGKICYIQVKAKEGRQSLICLGGTSPNCGWLSGVKGITLGDCGPGDVILANK